ncbi:MAG: hypothetical protein K6B28_08565 [Lachnospiraceae bacterium]|nr:hypothetical protein [Lachnospiraceae bacterium]
MEKLKICLLDGLKITKGGEEILDSINHTRKTKLLISYLLLNKNRAVPHGELFELLWSGEDYSNPGTALRTLLYRYRSLVDSVGVSELSDSIISRRGAYQWNQKLDIDIDIYDFEDYANLGINSMADKEARTGYLKKAIDIYRGNLLPDSQKEHWVVPKGVYYRDMYERTVLSYIGILKENKDDEEIIKVCERAMSIIGNTQILQNELRLARLGETEDKGFSNEHAVVARAYEDMEKKIDSLQIDMEKDGMESTAFICDFEMFKEVYRLQRRLLLRTGETMFLSMVTLRPLSQMKDPLRDERAMQALQDCLSHELRLGDSICRYTEDQFLIIYPVDAYEDARRVMERVKGRFFVNSGIEDYTLVFKIRPLNNSKDQ